MKIDIKTGDKFVHKLHEDTIYEIGELVVEDRSQPMVEVKWDDSCVEYPIVDAIIYFNQKIWIKK